MLESVLVRRNASIKTKITVKSIVAVSLVVLALILPQFVHLIGGAAGGAKWLPMYLPVLIGGCLLGVKWGIGVGIAAPITSYLVTLAFGNPMPALARLPFMIVELAVFALVSGAFGKKISENPVFAFPAVLLAGVAGRTTFVVLAAVFGSAVNLPVNVVWAQIQTGFIGLIVQAVIVPLIIIGLSKLIERNNK